MSMRLQYVRDAAVAELRKDIEINSEKYSVNDPWIDRFFADRPYLAESKVEIANLPELRNPESNTELFELENTIALHGALHALTPSQAADERLWVWLSHGPYWDYMRHRWPAEKGEGNFRGYILEH